MTSRELGDDLKLRRLALLVIFLLLALGLSGCTRHLPTGTWVDASDGRQMTIEKEWITDTQGEQLAYKVTGDSVVQLTLGSTTATARYELKDDTLTLSGPLSGVFNRAGSPADQAATAARAQAAADAAAAKKKAEDEAAATAAAEAAAAQRVQECTDNRTHVLTALLRYAINKWEDPSWASLGASQSDVLYPHVKSTKDFEGLVRMVAHTKGAAEFQDFGAKCPDGGTYTLTWSETQPLLTIDCSEHGPVSTDQADLNNIASFK